MQGSQPFLRLAKRETSDESGRRGEAGQTQGLDHALLSHSPYLLFKKKTKSKIKKKNKKW